MAMSAQISPTKRSTLGFRQTVTRATLAKAAVAGLDQLISDARARLSETGESESSDPGKIARVIRESSDGRNLEEPDDDDYTPTESQAGNKDPV